MKWITYQIAQSTVGEEDILITKKVGYSEANLAIAEAEAYDGYTIEDDEKAFSTTTEFPGDADMTGHKIKNLGEPTDDSDAATLGKTKELISPVVNDIAINRLTLGTQKKNLIDQSLLLNASGWTVDENGVYSGNIHNLHVYVQNGYPIETEFRENTQYTLSYDIKSEVNTSSTDQKTLSVMAFYTDGTSKLMGYHTATGEFEKFTVISLAGKTLKRIRFEYYNNRTCYIKNMQLEEGTVATAYEPYKPSVNERLVEVEESVSELTPQVEQNKSDILNMKSNMLISSSKTISEPNWYRVFSITPKGTSRTGLIMINRNFGSNSPENYLLSFSFGHNLNEFNLIKKLNEDSVRLIDNIRVVYANSSPNAKEIYIDIYYVSNSSNPVYISMLFGTSADCNIVPVNYTIAEVPEGYTSKEFSLATKDIFKRITALEETYANLAIAVQEGANSV